MSIFEYHLFLCRELARKIIGIPLSLAAAMAETKLASFRRELSYVADQYTSFLFSLPAAQRRTKGSSFLGGRPFFEQWEKKNLSLSFFPFPFSAPEPAEGRDLPPSESRDFSSSHRI